MSPAPIQVYFSDVFWIEPSTLQSYGAFDVSLVNDLPLFIDPFLLFHSANPTYQALHDDIIRYVAFLRDKAVAGPLTDGQRQQWFMFPEVKQTWLGYSREGNRGSGLGRKFARGLSTNLATVLSNFGEESVPRAPHLEKVCLINDRVGRDNISDFTTNLIKTYLLEYTQTFARLHLPRERRRVVHVPKVRFDYSTEVWASGHFELPFVSEAKDPKAYVILTPIDMLTKDDNWINKTDLINDLPEIVQSVPDAQLRSQLAGYLARRLSDIVRRDEEARRRNRRDRGSDRDRESTRDPNAKQTREAASDTVAHYPEIIDHYLRYKEDRGDEAEHRADERVRSSEQLYIGQVRELVRRLDEDTDFYRLDGDDVESARRRVKAMQRVLSREDGARLLFAGDLPIRLEPDLHIIARLTWLAVPERSSSSGGTTPPSQPRRARFDKQIVKFTLATNPKLSVHFEGRPTAEAVRLGQASMPPVLAIVCFSAADRSRVSSQLRALGMGEAANVFMLSAFPDPMRRELADAE